MKNPSRDLLEQLAEFAATMRRLDLRNHKKPLPMKEYFVKVLVQAGFNKLQIDRTWLSEMGKITGARGGRKRARLMKEGLIVPKRGADRKKPQPKRFNEWLFPVRTHPH